MLKIERIDMFYEIKEPRIYKNKNGKIASTIPIIAPFKSPDIQSKNIFTPLEIFMSTRYYSK